MFLNDYKQFIETATKMNEKYGSRDLSDVKDYYMLLYTTTEKNENKHWIEFNKEISEIEIS